MMIELVEIEAGSARYARADGSAIDCRVRLSHMPDTVLPYTATAGDATPHGKAIWDTARKMTVAAYVAQPEPEPVPDYDAELATAIRAAATLDELKAALVGNMANAKARVRAKPR